MDTAPDGPAPAADAVTETGVLALPTGRLIVGDPATLFADAKPLEVSLPRGSFQVSRTPTHVHLEFDAQPPDHWTQYPGFDSASGLGCLLDADALASFTDLGDEPVDEYELLVERFGADGAGLLGYGELAAFTAPGGVRTIRVGYRGGDAVCLDCETITKVRVQ